MSDYQSRIGLLGSKFGWGGVLLFIAALCFEEYRNWHVLGMFVSMAAIGFFVSYLGERRYKNKRPIDVDEQGNAKKRIL